jgi:hypothetical protein
MIPGVMVGFIERGREVPVDGTAIVDRIVNAFREGGRVAAFSEQTKFGGAEGERGINNEPVEVNWEWDFGQLKLEGGEYASGGGVCWVGFTGNISRVDGEGVVKLVEEGVDSAEYLIGGLAFAPVVSPPFHNALVVPVHPKMSARTVKP